MKLFSKGKSAARAAAAPTPFQPTDRSRLMTWLEQVISAGQSGVLKLRDGEGEWIYAFQGGGLVHASGGRTRGARQAFDLLWEFDQGEFLFNPGSDSGLGSNLYIDKGRLLNLLRQSRGALQAPGSPSMPPVQPSQAPATGQGAGMPAQHYPPANPMPKPMPQAPAVKLTPQPLQVPARKVSPPAPPVPASAAPAAAPIPPVAVVPPVQPPTPPVAATMAPPAISPPLVGPQPTPSVGRSIAPPPPAPPSFSVPPMPIPRRREATPAPLVQAPAPARASETQEMPKPAVETPKPPSTPQDDLRSLRASLAAQAPSPEAAPKPPKWSVRKPDGTVSAPGDARKGAQRSKPKKPSRLQVLVEDKTIRFLLWACERSYSPDDHWTVKDAFEVATLELRDQFLGAFSQAFKAPAARRDDDDEIDQVSAGRMRGRVRSRKR